MSGLSGMLHPLCNTPPHHATPPHSTYRTLLTLEYLELRLEVDAVEPALLIAQDATHAAAVDGEVEAEPAYGMYGQ